MTSPISREVSVRLDDLGDLGDRGRDAREVGLAHHDAHHGFDREPQRLGRHGALVGVEDAGSLQPQHARLHSVARQSEAVGEGDDGGAVIIGERAQQLEVDAIKRTHSAES